MASGPESAQDKDEESVDDIRKKNLKRRLKVKGQLWAILLQILKVLSRVVAPLFVILVFLLVDYVVDPVPVVTLTEPGIQMTGEGIKITHAIIGMAILRAVWNVIEITTDGFPSVDVAEAGASDD